MKETLRGRAIESAEALKATVIHRGTSEQIKPARKYSAVWLIASN
jgi:hypothetical protein